MGLFRAFTGSIASFTGDVWQDFIYCDAMSNQTLARRGSRKNQPGAGKYADENVITDGSRIAVSPGQMMIVAENGRVIDFTAEAGGYEFKSSEGPSVFTGEFGKTLSASADEVRERFHFGGSAASEQRVYFINTKEIPGNRFGFGGIPYRDNEFDITILLRGYGIFSMKISDPIVFYEKVCGNVAEKYDSASLLPQLRTELQSALLPILGELSAQGISFDKLSLETQRILDMLRNNVGERWKTERGIEISSIAFSNILPDEESLNKMRDLQESRFYSTSSAALGARLGAASANAMEAAADNPSGAAGAFMGINMANSMQASNVVPLMQHDPGQKEQSNDSWTCSCGSVNTTPFCPQCGTKRPVLIKWKCQCGMENTGLFCVRCGNPKPRKYICSKCAAEALFTTKVPKFCSECGNPFTEADLTED